MPPVNDRKLLMKSKTKIIKKVNFFSCNHLECLAYGLGDELSLDPKMVLVGDTGKIKSLIESCLK